jgi:hypothetical protein
MTAMIQRFRLLLQPGEATVMLVVVVMVGLGVLVVVVLSMVVLVALVLWGRVLLVVRALRLVVQAVAEAGLQKWARTTMALAGLVVMG